MTGTGWLQIALYFAVLLLLVKPLGAHMARVYEGAPTFLDRMVGPIERLVYRAAGVQPGDEMDWKTYAVAVLLFSAAGFAATYGLLRLQGLLPLNSEHLGAVAPELAFNTAVQGKVNEGATFSFTLPQVAQHESVRALLR